MRPFVSLPLAFLAFTAVGVGCSQNSASELAAAKADAEAARAEVASLRTELSKEKAELESFRGEYSRLKAAGASAKEPTQARLVAEGFLTAMTRPSVDQLHGFCTPDQRRRIDLITLPPSPVSWSIESAAIGESGREATFKGKFNSSAGKQDFVVLVIKTSAAGQERWLVDAFSVGGVGG